MGKIFEPNSYVEIDDTTIGIELFSKGEKFICLFDKEDYPRIKNFRWVLTSLSKRNRTRYVRSHPWRGGPSENWVMIFHQLIMSFPSNGQIDHINQNGLDNRKVNLRVVSHFENARNKIYNMKARSGYYGVVPNCSKERPWKAYFSLNKKSHYLGAFSCKEDAARAWDIEAARVRGEFAILNFPENNKLLA